IQLVKIPSGTFLMGSPNVLISEAPVHEVTIGYEFYLGKFLVTQHQWEVVMGQNNSAQFRTSLEHPVDSVSWEEAIAFCQKLSERCGARARLPSEAEWEYACRAGTQGEFFFGAAGPFVDETSVPSEVRHSLQEYAWFEENSREETHAVGLKKPNPWEFFDIVGNLWEWCEDVWHSDYVGALIDGSPWRSAADPQPRRCLRGGAWNMDAFRCRSFYRSWDRKDVATNRFGFRIGVPAYSRPRWFCPVPSGWGSGWRGDAGSNRTDICA